MTGCFREGEGNGGFRGMVAKGHGVSFGGDESVLKLTVVTSAAGVVVSCEIPIKMTVVMTARICEYTKNTVHFK